MAPDASLSHGLRWKVTKGLALSPLLDKRDVDARADAVQELVESPDLYEGLAKALKQKGIGDLERALQQLHTLGADRKAPSSDGQQHPDARRSCSTSSSLMRDASSSCVVPLLG